MKKIEQKVFWAICIAIIATCLMFLLLGCNTKFLVTNEIVKTLNHSKGTVVTFYENPAINFSVIVTDELISILAIEEWQPIKEIAHTSTELKMLYFDVFHEDGVTFKRVVIFSDATAFIQVNDGEFGEKKYYTCGGTSFSNLVTYISKHILNINHGTI